MNHKAGGPAVLTRLQRFDPPADAPIATTSNCGRTGSSGSARSFGKRTSAFQGIRRAAHPG